MEGLQRSSETFRRSGSSGLVWEDRFLTDELKKKEEEAAAAGGAPAADGGPELRPSRSVGSTGMLERNQSSGGRGYRTGRVSPALDPPSPKVSACGFCSFFGKPSSSKKPKSKSNPKPAAATKRRH